MRHISQTMHALDYSTNQTTNFYVSFTSRVFTTQYLTRRKSNITLVNYLILSVVVSRIYQSHHHDICERRIENRYSRTHLNNPKSRFFDISNSLKLSERLTHSLLTLSIYSTRIRLTTQLYERHEEARRNKQRDRGRRSHSQLITIRRLTSSNVPSLLCLWSDLSYYRTCESSFTFS